MATVAVNDDTFEAEVEETSGPVLVDFWANWCAPCKAIAPVLEELSEEWAGQLKIVKVDVDRAPMTQARFQVRSIPTLMLFEDGRPVTAVQGAMPKPDLIKFLEDHVSTLKGPTITVDELDTTIAAGQPPVQVIDIRDPRDFSRSHLRHARCIAADALSEALAEMPPQTLVVLVDRQGIGALEVAKTLGSQVQQTVLALQNGLLEWEGSGRATYSNKEEAALDA